MKAITYQKYGSPDVLRLEEVEQPAPAANEVLIRIRATTVAAEDCTFRKGSPFISRLATGLLKPKAAILGTQLAGEVVAVGKDVTLFKPGDQAFGDAGPGFGAYAEYIAIPQDGALAIKPEQLDYPEAAALCGGELTALPFLRDEGKVRSGQKVLINGASGSVGTAAVQLAKYFGTEVTGVCSTSNLEMVKSLGADEVIDYTREDFTRNGQAYDIIFDTVGKSSFSKCKGALKPGGIYLSTVLNPDIIFQMLRTSRSGGKKAKITFTGLRPPAEKAKGLRFFKTLAEEGHLQPVIDRRYRLEAAAEAHRYVEKGHKRGNVILTV